jgi:hypothetical protein
MQFLHPFDEFQNYKWLLRQSKLKEKSFWWYEKKSCHNWCRTSRENHKQQIGHYIKQGNHLHYICCVKSIYRIFHNAIGWQVKKLLGAIVNKESYSCLMVFHHWGVSKLERASKIEIILLTWDDMDAQKYFGSVKPYGL